jgi:Protein of unknown function (DUF2591)
MHVSRLSGAKLDDWVRRAEDRYGEPTEPRDDVDRNRRYSKDENLARPIMDREGIVVSYVVDARSGAQSLAWVLPAHGVDVPLLGRLGWLGDDDLEAAMRCYVAISFGEEIPD